MEPEPGGAKAPLLCGPGKGGLVMSTRVALNWVALILLIVGGLNWGLVGLFEFNLVAMLFGAVEWLERLTYILVGAAAIYAIFAYPRLFNHPSAANATRAP